jgi:hypothetical protein
MSKRTQFLAVVAASAALILTFAIPAASDDSPDLRTYRVTLVNLTDGQPFSPPVAATHRPGIHMFQVGRFASDELAAIAQGGDEVPMFNLFNGAAGATDAIDVGAPLTPVGKVVGSFVDTATFEIMAESGDRLSLATMLICTNDGFLGLDAVRLPSHGARAFLINGYDAGREQNTDLSQHLVDPCSALGPAKLEGDNNGNLDSGPGVSTDPPVRIHHHPNIHGGGHLSQALHGWRDPVAVAVVSRIDGEGEDEDD